MDTKITETEAMGYFIEAIKSLEKHNVELTINTLSQEFKSHYLFLNNVKKSILNSNF